MDPRLLRYYNRELQHLREMGGEFAKQFPKIAGRLGLEGFECADPYVERLLEGFSFLAARVQLKIDTEFPRFTQHLLEMIYPHYLTPTPSMAVVQFRPDLTEGALASGYVVPRETALRSLMGKGDQTPCEYRTAHDVTLWPLDVAEAEYSAGAAPLRSSLGLPNPKAWLRLRLRTSAGLTFDKLSLERVPLFLRGAGDLPMHLYEQLLANATAVVVQPPGREPPWQEVISKNGIRRVGFDDREALLPFGPRSFQGYRLLQEYFAFPERYLFVEVAGLAPAVRRCAGTELDVLVLLDRADLTLQSAVDASNFALHCSPAVNLFPKRADRIHLSENRTDYHVVPDRTRPTDYEVYQVTGVVGHGTSGDREQEFLPLYSADDLTRHGEGVAYYCTHRMSRVASAQQARQGPRSSYPGSEVFVSLVDAQEAPYRTELRQLAVGVLCTNRDLPLMMPLGQGRSDFTLESGAPVEAIRCVAGPTKPKPSPAEGETTWQLIGQLSLNYQSLLGSEEKHDAAALRELLTLYAGTGQADIQKHVEALRSIQARPVLRRIHGPGPLSFGRGIEVTVTFDESTFGGRGAFLLGGVLQEFFARYVSINSFTETVVRTLDRGELIRWPSKTGLRHLL